MLRPSHHIEVTVATARVRPGIRVHRAWIPQDEVTTERRIPVTSLPRTLFDLAALVPRAQVERAIKEAEIRGLGDRLSLPDLLARYPRRRGATTIRSILEQGATLTRSELEALFLSCIEQVGLPPPEVNRPLLVGGRWIECDCVWPSVGVIVELDGFAVHGTAAAVESDRARDRMLQARGWRLIRVTWSQLRDHPQALARDLRALVAMFPRDAARDL